MKEKIELSTEQNKIVQCDGNIVVIADPGSGKTTTMGYKIKKILSENKFKGVIAISYTNKASEELKSKVKMLVDDIKLSYFGTIDKFYISEIIIPFAKDIIGEINKYEVIKIEDINSEQNIENNNFELEYAIQQLKEGKIVLNTIGILGNYIFDYSMRCKRYLKARYSHIIIDEFQDCNIEQYNIFQKMVKLGILGIGVGDPNQSIFRYDKRDSKYLISLTSDENFNTFILNKNHRCHQSIINYSLRFLSPKAEIQEAEEKRIYRLKVQGDERLLAQKIDILIEKSKKKFEIDKNCKIAILVRNNSTGNNIAKYLKTKNKKYINSVLDESSNIIDMICKDLLSYIIGNNDIFIETIFEKYDTYSNIKEKNKKKIKSYLQKQRQEFILNGKKSINIERIKEIVDLILNYESANSEFANLNIVLNDEEMFQSLFKIEDDTIPIMSIHKAKGLEFDVVFILDIHKYIIPREKFNPSGYLDLEECRNVHYVALTRAKKAVILCLNTIRTNSKGELKNGIMSEFIRDDLRILRNENSNF